ncbi:hypothetical protein M0804_006939 [Polistes exclamans]|nr:hypothetical protein M0804_006939 [Polistes exclamans]
MLKFRSPPQRRSNATTDDCSINFQVNPGSKAAQQGAREGDLISSINDKSTRELTNSEAHALLRNAGDHLKLGLNQNYNEDDNNFEHTDYIDRSEKKRYR